MAVKILCPEDILLANSGQRAEKRARAGTESSL